MLAFTAAAGFSLGGCYAGGGISPTSEQYIAGYAPDELRELTAAEKEILHKSFIKTLKDPDSAKIAWTKVPKIFPAGPTFEYCATMNAKNAFGGYVGYAPFMGTITTTGGKITGGYVKALASGDAVEQGLVSEMCAKKGLDAAPRT